MKAVTQKLAVASVLAVCLLFGTTSSAKANDGFLVLNTIALHFENFDDRNAFTPGIGWEYSPSSKLGFHVGTLSDSFGFQSSYAGINYASKPKFYGKLRFLVGATVLHKQFRKNAEPETKVVPFPAVEFRLNDTAVINLSGSPQVDFADQRNNAVLFFQLKLRLP